MPTAHPLFVGQPRPDAPALLDDDSRRHTFRSFRRRYCMPSGRLAPYVLACCLSFFATVSTAEPPSLAPHLDSHGDPLPPGAVARLGSNRFRVPWSPRSLAYSPKGDFLAVACRSQIVRWDSTTGKPLPPIEFANEEVAAFAFSADGKRLVVAASFRKDREEHTLIHVIDRETGRRVDLPCKVVDVEDVSRFPFALSPDGGLVAFADKNGTPCFWDCVADKSVALLDGAGEESLLVDAFAFSADGRRLAVAFTTIDATRTSTIKLVDLKRRKILAKLDARNEVTSLSLSANGALLLTTCLKHVTTDEYETSAHIWNVDEKTESLVVKRDVTTSILSPDDRFAVVAHSDARLSVWDSRTNKRIRDISTVDMKVAALAVAPDGKHIAGVNACGVAQSWDVASGREVFNHTGHRGCIESLTFSPDGLALASIGSDACVRLWDVRRAVERRMLPLPAREYSYRGTSSLAFSSDGSRLAAATQDFSNSKLRIWGVDKGDLSAELQPDEGGFQSFCFVSGGKFLATSSECNVQFWSVPAGEKLHSVVPAKYTSVKAESNNYHLAVTPSGRLLAVSPHFTDLIQLFDAADRRQIREIHTDRCGAGRIAFSADGRAVASGGIDREPDRPDDFDFWRGRRVSLWETATGQSLGSVGDGKGRYLFDFALSPDGQFVATVDAQDDDIHIWHIASGKDVARLHGDHGRVFCIAFSPDGKLLAAGSSDGTILLWDATLLPRRSTLRPDAKTVVKLWNKLVEKANPDPLKDVRSLAAAGDETVALIRDKVRPIPTPDAREIERLVADLEDQSFAVRSAAADRLAALGPLVETVLRRALESGGSADFKKQVKRLLETARGDEPAREELSSLRSVWVLELIATPPAQQHLKKLASGGAGHPLTLAAQESLARLARRAPQ